MTANESTGQHLTVQRFTGQRSNYFGTIAEALDHFGAESTWYIADPETGDIIWNNPQFPYGK